MKCPTIMLNDSLFHCHNLSQYLKKLFKVSVCEEKQSKILHSRF